MAKCEYFSVGGSVKDRIAKVSAMSPCSSCFVHGCLVRELYADILSYSAWWSMLRRVGCLCREGALSLNPRVSFSSRSLA